LRDEGPCCVKPTHIGHRKIHKQHVRLETARHVDRLAAIARFPHHIQAARLQQAAEAVPKERVIVG
jgi:hypothetical protein